MATLVEPLTGSGPEHSGSHETRRPVVWMTLALAALSTVSALVGIVSGGGPGRHDVTTARGVEVTLYGEGLYAADSWLVGAGNRGQDVVLLLVEVPLLLLALGWWTSRRATGAVAVTGVLSFFTYYWVSMTFANAQNALFPLYVACFGLCAFLMVAVTQRLDVRRTAALLPARPGRLALATYLFAVAGALGFAWLPGLVATALRDDAASVVGPYTSSATEALDLGIVVPVAVVTAVLLLRRTAGGAVLTLVMLVVNVCIGLLLMGQGVAQLVDGVPLTPAEIVAKMATFAALTVVAGGLLARMALTTRHPR